MSALRQPEKRGHSSVISCVSINATTAQKMHLSQEKLLHFTFLLDKPLMEVCCKSVIMETLYCIYASPDMTGHLISSQVKEPHYVWTEEEM